MFELSHRTASVEECHNSTTKRAAVAVRTVAFPVRGRCEETRRSASDVVENGRRKNTSKDFGFRCLCGEKLSEYS
jgi:hypothetical protein